MILFSTPSKSHSKYPYFLISLCLALTSSKRRVTHFLINYEASQIAKRGRKTQQGYWLIFRSHKQCGYAPVPFEGDVTVALEILRAPCPVSYYVFLTSVF